MEVPESFIIHDTRTSTNFKGITICGYKRRDVLNAYQNAMINNKLEDAIRWCVELHSTGLNKQIWESLQNLYIKYIHINNPKFLFYLKKREKNYQNIIKNYPKKHEIFSRNDQEIRNLFAELTAISTLTKKNNMFLPKSLPTINNNSFQKEEIYKRIISKNLDKIIHYVFNSTTNNAKISLNEIINNLSLRNGTYQNCIYWYLWLEKIDKMENNKLNNIVTNNLSNNLSDNKYFDHWTFILWKIILSFEIDLPKNDFILIKKMHSIYKKNFKLSHISKKKYYFFIAFFTIKNNIKWNINIFQSEHLIIQSNANINRMYENIIRNIESNLSEETKNLLYKNYQKLFNNINNSKEIVIKKVKNTNLDEDINTVLFTRYPEYKDLQGQTHQQKEAKVGLNKVHVTQDSSWNHSNRISEHCLIDNRTREMKSYLDSGRPNEMKESKKLVSKNMTLRDVEEIKDEKKNKKIDAFTQFVSFKKNNKSKPVTGDGNPSKLISGNFPETFIKKSIEKEREREKENDDDSIESMKLECNKSSIISRSIESYIDLFNDNKESTQEIKNIHFSKKN